MRWTRRGGNIEIAPRPSSDYDGLALRVEGTRYAAGFSVDSTEVSDISNADKGLIYYGVAESYGEMGDENKSAIWKTKWLNWLDQYKSDYAKIAEYEGGLFFDDGIE